MLPCQWQQVLSTALALPWVRHQGHEELLAWLAMPFLATWHWGRLQQQLGWCPASPHCHALVLPLVLPLVLALALALVLVLPLVRALRHYRWLGSSCQPHLEDVKAARCGQMLRGYSTACAPRHCHAGKHHWPMMTGSRLWLAHSEHGQHAGQRASL